MADAFPALLYPDDDLPPWLRQDPQAAALLDTLRQGDNRPVAPIWDPNNPVGTETIQSMGMPAATSHGGPISEFVNPSTGQLTARGQARMDDNPALGFDTGGIAGMTRAARGVRAAARLVPEVPEFSADAAPYIREGAPVAVVPPPPAVIPELGLLGPGQLYDPALGAQARAGATQGMTAEEYAARNAARRGLMDDNIASLNKIGTGERGNASLPDLRAMTPEDAANAARGDPHLAFKRPDGNYVGAPVGTTSPEDVQRLRDAFDAQVARGVGGSNWYGRVQKYIGELSGGDPVKARQIAEVWAKMSAQADPGTNTGFALQAVNRYLREGLGGDPGIVRTGEAARAFWDARRAQDAFLARQNPLRNSIPGTDEALDTGLLPGMRQGKKTAIYEQHMDPTARAGSTGTNDIWHGRAFGFVDPKTGQEWDKAFGPASHNWLDYETMQALNRANDAGLGGRTDWKPGEIQAAPWVSGKSESLQRRYGVDAAEGDRRANATYPDYAHWYTADMPHEQVPGGSTGLTTGSMTPEQWQAAARRVNPGGLDPQLEHLGFFNRATTPGTGAWVEGKTGLLETNPVDVSRPQIDTMTDANDKRVFHQGTMAALESAAAVRGLSDMQIGNPVTMMDRRAPSSQRTSVTIDLGRGLLADEAMRLHALGKEYNLDLGNSGTGAHLLNFDDAAKGRDVQKTLDEGLAMKIRAIVPAAQIGRASQDPTSKYVNYNTRLRAANEGKGIATRYMDKILQRNEKAAPGFYQGLLDDPNEAAKAQQNLERLRASGQIGVRPDYERWQRLIAEGRLRQALEWARANGYQGLPAAAGGVGLSAGLLGGDDSTGPGS
jgi:hypothetical protein